MLDKFNLYIDMFGFSKSQNLSKAAEQILQNPGKKILNFSNDHNILDNFGKLVNNKISEESFFTYWDISNKDKQTPKKQLLMEAFFQIYYLLEESPEDVDNSLIFVDKSAVKYFKTFSESKYFSVLDNLSKRSSQILEI